jgi:hypothetical protein
MEYIVEVDEGQFEIDQSLINNLEKDDAEFVTEWVEKLNKSGDALQDATTQLNGATKNLKEFKNSLKNQSVDFFNRVKDALIESYQRQIDNLSKINDTMNESNSNIISAMRENIELQRQERTNAETEQNIEDKQIQLAYLRQDTTGAN